MDADVGGRARLSHSELLELKRWNTPTIYNGWEQITDRDAARECFSLEVCHDFMPEMGPMVGYGATVVAHSRYVTFQMAEVAIPKRLFRTILRRISRLGLLAPVPTRP